MLTCSPSITWTDLLSCFEPYKSSNHRCIYPKTGSFPTPAVGCGGRADVRTAAPLNKLTQPTCSSWPQLGGCAEARASEFRHFLFHILPLQMLLWFPAGMLPALGGWGNNTEMVGFPKQQGAQAGTQWGLRTSLNRGALEKKRFAGEESTSRMGITQYQSKTWLDLLSSPLFHFLPWCQTRHALTQCTLLGIDSSSFLSITTETWDLLQAQQESKPSPSPKHPVSPPGTSQGAPTTHEPVQWRARAATHRLWAGPWPRSVAPAGSSRHSPPPLISSSCVAPASQPLPGNPTLSFSIQPHSSSQEPEHLWPDGRARVVSQKQYWRSPVRQTWWQSRSRVKFLVQHPSLPVMNELLASPLLHRNAKTLKRGHTVTKPACIK